jgi:small subunit ribosomal protein S13
MALRLDVNEGLAVRSANEIFEANTRFQVLFGADLRQGLIWFCLFATVNFGERVMSKDFRLVLRVAGTNIDGTKKVVYGISHIRGVGPSYAAAIVKAVEIRPEVRMGDLSEAEVQKLEDAMRDPAKYGLPPRLFNRRKGLDSGRDMHLIGADLTLSTKSDIDFMTDIRTWKGVRHSLGLKVRGQRTRTTGRKGRAVGVAKKVVMEAARAAALAGDKEEKK